MQNDSPSQQRKRPQGLAHDIVTALTQHILLGQMVPGEKLPSESTLVAEYGVSRTVVREAISKLQAAGLVETRHGVGSFVLERDERRGLHLAHDTAVSVRGILELRLGLETQAAALAAMRRTDQQLLQMRQALDDYQDSLANNDSSVEPDVRFHRLIAQATGNTYFTDAIYHLGHSVIPRTRINAQERGDVDLMKLGQMANLEHEAILKAIRRQDPDAARAAMWLHLSNSLERMTGE
ncbi:FadR/GntR family transcriptional regulator [Pseudomonas mucidolens]|uniref:DNA-binding transcriptional regulator, FadR family n=1 Tax=Pseudomonas mucidolens TaxID=46679 RepID=A0A1H2MK94_9PSED|nr:FadR/GntR family transcriptional regulator [Pseudomonas mucidolens]SDU93494.1 DNA-binding transcriptional regulator, FadR family [Pseudomonas mucidolens]SQH33723.1 GntR family transcriptional regulator [Pseudomonas mucidolens]